ncbi:MAG: hypothetical protein ACTXOO_04325 [Sodalis sp. (in: enterobacteria)]
MISLAYAVCLSTHMPCGPLVPVCRLPYTASGHRTIAYPFQQARGKSAPLDLSRGQTRYPAISTH